MDTNLNRLIVRNDEDGIRSIERASTACSEMVTVLFDGIEDAISTEIRKASIVVGCVAWFTNERLLRDLAKKDAVSFVVQKEDFLRPDGRLFGDRPTFKENLRRLYDALPMKLRVREDDEETIFFGTNLPNMSQCSWDMMVDPVRCFGVTKGNGMSQPRMHHKFAVLFNRGELLPSAAITGSWNWTKNATQSIENAVIIRDQKIARGYFEEYAHVLSLSEPLDWDTEYVSPEWRIGT